MRYGEQTRLGRTEGRRMTGQTGALIRTARAGLLVLGLLWAALPAWGGTRAVEGGIEFTYVNPRAQSVAVAGDFNNWSASAAPMTQEDGVWTAVVSLEPGEYEYKFVVDTQWFADPDNPVTVGEYGNSALTVGPDGKIVAMRATSNTPLSPKIWAGGRFIGLYQAMENAQAGDRYELRRPSLDIDLDYQIRINSDLTAHVLTNINNESENVRFYETRLNFDRGSLTLDNDEIFLQAWDNEGVETWDDPLHLVGNVGIYDHVFGYGTAGARAAKEYAGFRGEILYADDRSGGGSSFPAAPTEALMTEGKVELREDDSYRFALDRLYGYSYFENENQEDVMAARLTRELGRRLGGEWKAGASFRLDRGFRPGAVAYFEGATDTTGTLFTYDNSYEQWRGFGGDVKVKLSAGPVLEAEFLHGRSWIDAYQGNQAAVELNTIPGEEGPEGSLSVGERTPASDREIRLDDSNRAWLGVSWESGLAGADWSLGWEYQDHQLRPAATNLTGEIENSMSAFRGGLTRSWNRFPVLGVRTETGVSFEYFTFDYDEEAPWNTQFWFDSRNLWLDGGEHKVGYDRLTLLGGRDAFIWRPEMKLHLQEARRLQVGYAGLLGSEGVDRKPKYFESILTGQVDLARAWVARLDTRLVRYDDPILELDGSFHSYFAEVAYSPAEGVTLALSYGVDPWVVDPPVNEFAYIGRDQYLFDQGADPNAAKTNFRGLGKIIDAAEQSLQDERRIQLEAILEF